MEGSKLKVAAASPTPTTWQVSSKHFMSECTKVSAAPKAADGQGKNQELTSAAAQKEARENRWIDVKEPEVKSSRQGTSSV